MDRLLDKAEEKVLDASGLELKSPGRAEVSCSCLIGVALSARPQHRSVDEREVQQRARTAALQGITIWPL